MTKKELTRLKREKPTNRKTSIIHLGPGAFFRAFNAIYTMEATGSDKSDWGIGAISLKSATVRDALKPQGYDYTSITLNPDGNKNQIIDILNFILVGPENPENVLKSLSHPDVKIVSLTITEKGYCYNPEHQGVNFDDPEIKFDLAHPSDPKTAIGYIVSALNRRRQQNIPPFTVLSCDNMPDNGKLTQKVILDFAQKVDPELADWISLNGAFPSTMVDRITPATTLENISNLKADTGYIDQGCVVHEPFRQWVIEDNFVKGDRPNWDRAGAQFVNDVAPFELMKLRCLNGTHSAIAYLGYLAGYQTVFDTMSDRHFETFIDYLWHTEITPSLPPIPNQDLSAYCTALKHRYLNSAIAHKTGQIAMDGSQKLPQRLLGTISDNLSKGLPIEGLALAVAAWMRYVGGIDEQGNSIEVKDPMVVEIQKALKGIEKPDEQVSTLLSFNAIFPPKLAVEDRFHQCVINAYSDLHRLGAQKTVKNFCYGLSISKYSIP